MPEVTPSDSADLLCLYREGTKYSGATGDLENHIGPGGVRYEKVEPTRAPAEKLERTRSKTAVKKLETQPTQVRREREKMLRRVEEAAGKKQYKEDDA